MLGRHVQQLRDTQGFSQQALADEADIAKPTIQRIEKGQAASTVDIILSLAKALDLPFCDLANAPLALICNLATARYARPLYRLEAGVEDDKQVRFVVATHRLRADSDRYLDAPVRGAPHLLA